MTTLKIVKNILEKQRDPNKVIGEIIKELIPKKVNLKPSGPFVFQKDDGYERTVLDRLETEGAPLINFYYSKSCESVVGGPGKEIWIDIIHRSGIREFFTIPDR